MILSTVTYPLQLIKVGCLAPKCELLLFWSQRQCLRIHVYRGLLTKSILDASKSINTRTTSSFPCEFRWLFRLGNLLHYQEPTQCCSEPKQNWAILNLQNVLVEKNSTNFSLTHLPLGGATFVIYFQPHQSAEAAAENLNKLD